MDGVCQVPYGYPNAGALNAFGPGDYGPSGEDVRHRFVVAGTVHLPGGFELSTINQVESARPITITNQNNSGRIWVQFSGESQPTYTGLDVFRGTPYIQSDLRITRPFRIGDRWVINPFAEFFNIFNRNNPGANFAVNVAQLPVPAPQMVPNQYGQTIVSSICTVADCSQTVPITSLKQLEIPAVSYTHLDVYKRQVSVSTVTLLTRDELNIALKHELAHRQSRDNLKKLVFRFCPFPGMAKLESAWSQAAEFAADDAAVSNLDDAVDLAAALVKLSRLVPVEAAPVCTVRFVTGCIGARVARLLVWDEAAVGEARQLRMRPWYVIPPLLVAMLCVFATYGPALTLTHEMTEWLVR